jgi:hypothetical protein
MSGSKASSGTGTIDGIIAQNTAEALQLEQNNTANENLQMQLQYGLEGQQIEAQTAVQLADITTSAQQNEETIAANTAAYIQNSNNQAQEADYAEGLVAAQNITAMQIKGAASSHVASAMASEANSVAQVVEGVAADNAAIAQANTKGLGMVIGGIGAMFAAPGIMSSVSGLVKSAAPAAAAAPTVAV